MRKETLSRAVTEAQRGQVTAEGMDKDWVNRPLPERWLEKNFKKREKLVCGVLVEGGVGHTDIKVQLRGLRCLVPLLLQVQSHCQSQRRPSVSPPP